MSESRVIKILFRLWGEIRPFADQYSFEKLSGLSGVNILNRAQNPLSDISDKGGEFGRRIHPYLLRKRNGGSRIYLVQKEICSVIERLISKGESYLSSKNNLIIELFSTTIRRGHENPNARRKCLLPNLQVPEYISGTLIILRDFLYNRPLYADVPGKKYRFLFQESHYSFGFMESVQTQVHTEKEKDQSC